MSSLSIAFSSYNKKRPTAFVIKIKKNKNGELDELLQFTQFLDESYESPPITQRIKHYAANDFAIHACPICQEPLSFREKPNPGYLKTCGTDECQRKQNYLATKESLIKTRGVENISQTKEWREKVKATNIERRGVEWNTQTEECVKKRKEKWETSKEEIIEKRRNSNVKKYGAAHHFNNQDINDKLKSSIRNSQNYQINRILKSKEKNIKKYSTWYCATSECQDKKYQRKPYIFPSGRTEMVQGYEPFALDELLQIGVHEDDIVVTNARIEEHIGKIMYIDDNGKNHRYFPDIYIISENKVIEVKSEYTLSRDLWINNKRDATIRSGFTYELKVY
jgi:hypothetical protein